MSGPKFRRRAEARPDEVLDAALALFEEKGFAATRVDDIAKRAGLSKGSVYLYFPSKQSLIEGLVRRAVVVIATGTIEMIAKFEGDPRGAISRAMRMLSAQLANPNMMAVPRIIMREVVNFPELAAMYRAEVLDKVIPVMTRLVEKGVREGYFRPVDPELTIRSIVGPMLIHVFLAEIFGVIPQDGLEFNRMVENHLTILFEGLSVREEATK